MAVTTRNDDFASDTTTTGGLTSGATQTAKLEVWADHDWFKANLKAGVTYRFTLDPMGLYNYSDYGLPANIVLRDAQGGSTATASTYYFYSKAYVQYTPAADGAYYLDVGGQGPSPGTYQVTMDEMPPDAVPSQPAGAPVLNVGVKTDGVFDYAGDSDWYRFHAEVGQHLKFSTPKGDAADAVFASNYEFYDASGNLLGDMYPFEPLVSGDYYVAVQGGYKGSYTLLMTDLVDDYAGNASTSGVLVPGGAAVSGRLEYAYDSDAFRMTAQAGRIYTVTISGAAQEMRYVHYGLSGPDGNYLASAAKHTDSQTTFTFKAAVGGDYLISAISYASSEVTVQPAYTVQADAGVADDYGDDIAGATAVSLGQSVPGVLQGDADVDMVKLDLQAGVTYALAATAAAGSAIHANLQLLDASGKSIAGDYQQLAQFTYTAPAAGTYYVRISGAAQAYTFSATAAQDDYGATPALAGTLAVGGGTKGAMESSGDIDWLAVDLTAGVTYWFDSDSTDKIDFRTYGGPGIALVDAHGDMVASRPWSNVDSTPVMQYVPAVSGTYYVQVTPYSSGSPPHYVVTAKIGEQDDYGDTRAGAATMAADTPVKGRLALPEDTDMFKFTANAGTAYIVEVVDSKGKVRGNGFSVNVGSDLPLADTVRETAGSSYDNKTKLFEPQAGGDYYFTVQGDGRVSGDYTLRLTAIAGDTTAAGASTTATLKAGQPVHSALESRYDSDWYKVALQSGHTYVAQLQGALTGNGTLNTLPLGLSIMDGGSSAASVGRADSSSAYSEPVLTFNPWRSGDYYVAVDAAGMAAGSYTLQLTDITNDRQGPRLQSVSHSADVAMQLYDTIVLTFDERIKVNPAGVSLKSSGDIASLDSVIGQSGRQLALDNKLVLDPHGRLDAGATYTLELTPGSVTDAAGNPYSGPMSFTFKTRPYAESGTPDNDFILGGQGTAPVVHGGAGIDTVVYDNSAWYYDVKGLGNGTFSVAPRYSSMPGSTDTLEGVERLELKYDHIALDIDGAAGQAYRLYRAAFNRTPDGAGVGYWIAQLDKGMNLLDVARSFVASDEFQKLYGASPTDAAFVDLLYNNVLHRTADQQGADYWVGALHDGLSREQALVYFSEGTENHDAVAKLIANGFSYTPYG